MGGWISKAVNVFKREVPEAPQPFEVPCECGQRHAGLRRARHQHLVCKRCGASIFILPRDVYPPPHTPLKASPKATASPTALVEEVDLIPEAELLPDELLADDDVRELPASSPSQRHRDLPAPRPTKRQRLRQKLAEQEQPEQVSPSQGPGLLEQLGRGLTASVKRGVSGFIQFWTPFRAIAAAVLGVLALTGLWSLHQGRLSRAAILAKTEITAGVAAVEKEEWIAARNHFEQATKALNLLERHDPEAERARQYFFETRALTQLCNVTLFDLLNGAPAIADEKDADEWQKTFASRYGGTWLIVDATVHRTKPGRSRSGEAAYALTFPPGIIAAGKTVTLRADFPVFDKIASAQGEADAIFAGELERCELADEGREWVVWLRPDTGFLWANPETYKSLGFENDPARPDESFEARLVHQSQRLGLAP